MSKTKGLSRRTFLRGSVAGGAGIGIGLPLLDAMTNLSGTALADGSALPLRHVTWFWGLGVPLDWAPSETGTAWTATPVLQPLAGDSAADDLRGEVTLISGTSLPTRYWSREYPMFTPSIESACGILTGTNPLPIPDWPSDGIGWDDADWFYVSPGAASLDQVAAPLCGHAARLSVHTSIAVPPEVPARGTAGYRISHRAPFEANEPQFDPGALFAELFGTPTDRRYDRARASVLDAVIASAAGLRRRLGPLDRAALDRHLDAIRAIELRLDGLACDPGAPPMVAGSERARGRLLADIVAMAFACDLTRVATAQLGGPIHHSALPDVFPDGLRLRGEEVGPFQYVRESEDPAGVLAMQTYAVACFADVVRALRATAEADGTVLDRTVVLGTSGHGPISDDEPAVPILLAGRAGGALRTGVHLRADGQLATRAGLTVLQALDPSVGSWGQEQFTALEPFDLLV